MGVRLQAKGLPRSVAFYYNKNGIWQKCLVLKWSEFSIVTPAMIAICVYDCIVISHSTEFISELMSRFHEKDSVKDLRDAKWILNIQIGSMWEKDSEVLWIGQLQDVKRLQTQFGAWLSGNSRETTTPIMMFWKHEDGSSVSIVVNKAIYRLTISSMSYLAQQSRLDIVYAVNHLAQVLKLRKQSCMLWGTL